MSIGSSSAIVSQDTTPTTSPSPSLSQPSLNPSPSSAHPLTSSPIANPTISHSTIPLNLATAISSSAPSSSIHNTITRERDGTHKLNPKYALTISIAREPIEPSCYSQAAKHLEWRAALGVEFDASQKCGTRSLLD